MLFSPRNVKCGVYGNDPLRVVIDRSDWKCRMGAPGRRSVGDDRVRITEGRTETRPECQVMTDEGTHPEWGRTWNQKSRHLTSTRLGVLSSRLFPETSDITPGTVRPYQSTCRDRWRVTGERRGSSVLPFVVEVGRTDFVLRRIGTRHPPLHQGDPKSSLGFFSTG